MYEASIKIPDLWDSESFGVGEHMEFWGEWWAQRAWKLFNSTHIPCLRCLSHLAVLELYPLL